MISAETDEDRERYLQYIQINSIDISVAVRFGQLTLPVQFHCGIVSSQTTRRGFLLERI